MSYDLTEDGPSGGHVRRAYIAAFMDLVPEIDSTAFIAPTAAVIGAVRIGANSSVWHQVTMRGDNNYIAIFAFLQKFRVKCFVYRLIADVECRAIIRNSLPFQTSFP